MFKYFYIFLYRNSVHYIWFEFWMYNLWYTLYNILFYYSSDILAFEKNLRVIEFWNSYKVVIESIFPVFGRRLEKWLNPLTDLVRLSGAYLNTFH